MTQDTTPKSDTAKTENTAASATKEKAKDVFDVTLTIMQDLSSLMTEELARLDSHDLKGVQDLLPMKNRLVLDYNANLKAINSNPDLINSLSEEKREKMKVIGKKLEEIADANASAFKAAVEGTETILHNIMMQVREDSRTYQTYRDLRAGSAPSKEQECKPVAVNRTA